MDSSRKTAATRRPAFDFDFLALLFVLPFFNMLMIGQSFLWVPLHFLDQQYSLTSLAFLFLLGGLGRLVTSPLINRYGDYSWICLGMAALLSTILLLLHSNEFVPLFISITCLQNANGILPLQGLVQLKYATTSVGASQELHQTALRIFTASETLGYATATLVGGVLFEYGGGWRACVWVQLIALSLQVGAFVVSPTVHEDLRRSASCCCFGNRREEDSGEDVPGTLNPASSPPPPPTTTVVNGGHKSDEEIFQHIKGPFIVLLGAHCISVLAYSVEFVLFAVYFKQVFGWSSTWTGAAQMSGDLLAAAVLFTSVCCFQKEDRKEVDAKQIATEDTTTTAAAAAATTTAAAALVRWYHLFLEPPFNITLLLLSIALLYAVIVIPIFACAVFAQILMGSVYVFGLQACNEFFSELSQGSRALYRKIAFIARFAYDVMFAIAPLALIVYDNVDHTTPFVVTSVVALGWAAVYTVYMACTWSVRCEEEVSGGEGRRHSRVGADCPLYHSDKCVSTETLYEPVETLFL